MRSSLRRKLPYVTALGAMAIMLVKLTGCGGGDDSNPGNPNNVPPGDTPPGDTPPGGPLTIAPGPSRGSAIAVSPDDSIVVSVNRDVGSVTVFKTTFAADNASAKIDKSVEIKVGAEPFQVVISPDGDSAYVILKKDQKVVKIGSLKTAPAVAGEVVVGSEPTGIALTPGGTKAWVANWVDGTLTGVDLTKMEVGKTIDLNAALVATGLVGNIAARPSLAHPRSIAITNNGDQNEDDEYAYVTEYYAQRTTAEAADGANADTAKSALVYKVKLADQTVETIRLAPIADMGFKDSAGGTAGCYPNQLQSITIQDHYAYVASVCASPKGPVGAVTTVVPPNLANIKTTTHGALSVIDITTGQEVTAATSSLHKRFDDSQTKAGLADDGSRRYPAVPVDVGFVKGGNVAYVVANAADAVFRLKFDFTAADPIIETGSPTSNAFINLNPSTLPADKSGQNPIGIATPNVIDHKRFAFVANDVTRNVSVLDFNAQSLMGGTDAQAQVTRAADLPAPNSTEDRVRKGKRFFETATGRWSLKGQGWNGCQSCHMDGLTDNVTWYFARGPRQSTSLDGTYNKKDPTDVRIMNWSAINDEVSDFEGNTRGISGGVGAIAFQNSTPAPTVADRIDNAALGHNGLAGSSDQVADPANPLSLAQPSIHDDWQLITEYVKTIRSPRKPSNLDGAKVAAGKSLFTSDGSCAGCHGGDKWTISSRFYTPAADTANNLNTKAWVAPAGFPAALLPAVDQKFMRFNNGNAAAFDQIQCILRPVGTFGKADAITGAMPELRQDMLTAGQGNQTNGNGFNPPSLLGLQTGAPYLHGGGATTLESLFSTTFKDHYVAFSPNFLDETDPAARADKVSQLVQYLLSIDADAPTVASPVTAGAQGGNFCALP